MHLWGPRAPRAAWMSGTRFGAYESAQYAHQLESKPDGRNKPRPSRGERKQKEKQRKADEQALSASAAGGVARGSWRAPATAGLPPQCSVRRPSRSSPGVCPGIYLTRARLHWKSGVRCSALSPPPPCAQVSCGARGLPVNAASSALSLPQARGTEQAAAVATATATTKACYWAAGIQPASLTTGVAQGGGRVYLLVCTSLRIAQLQRAQDATQPPACPGQAPRTTR